MIQDLKTLSKFNSPTPINLNERGSHARLQMRFNRIDKKRILVGMALSLLAIFALQVDSTSAAPLLTDFVAQSPAVNQWFTRPVILIALALTAAELMLIALIMVPTMWVIGSKRRKSKLRTIQNKKYIPLKKNLPVLPEGEIVNLGANNKIAELVDLVDLAEFEEELVAA